MPNNTKDKPPYYGRPPYAAVCLLENRMGVSVIMYRVFVFA